MTHAYATPHHIGGEQGNANSTHNRDMYLLPFITSQKKQVISARALLSEQPKYGLG